MSLWVGILVGACGGFFGGLVGLGGGVVMIPLMVSALRFTQHQAHGTSLVAVVATGLMGAVSYALHGTVDLFAAALLAVTATATARAGARYAGALPGWKLKKYFGIFLCIVSTILLVKSLPVLLTGKALLPSVNLAVGTAGKVVVLLAIGVITGFISGMMGVGGGVFMVGAMVLVAGMGQHVAQGSSLLAMVPASAVGAMTHNRLGNVRKDIVAGLVLGSLLGTFGGGSLANVLPEHILQVIFALVLLQTGARYAQAKPPRPAPAAAPAKA